jgi:hypothetical protein
MPKSADRPPTLFEFLDHLEAVNASFRLARIRHESLMVEVFAPGEHWEVEFMRDGSVEIERYRSSGEIHDQSVLKDLWGLFQPLPDRKTSPRKSRPKRRKQ